MVNERKAPIIVMDTLLLNAPNKVKLNEMHKSIISVLFFFINPILNHILIYTAKIQ